MKNKLQPTRTRFSRNFQCKKASRWLSKLFHFGTENGVEQLKKAPCTYQKFCITNLWFCKGKPISGVARKKWQTVERVDLSVAMGPFWHLVGDQFDLIAGTEVLNEILRICYFLLFYINLGKIPFCWIVLLIIPCVFARGIIGEADNKD